MEPDRLPCPVSKNPQRLLHCCAVRTHGQSVLPLKKEEMVCSCHRGIKEFNWGWSTNNMEHGDLKKH